MNESNAMLCEYGDNYGSLTMRSGVSIRFLIGDDPEVMMSGLLDPEDMEWIS